MEGLRYEIDEKGTGYYIIDKYGKKLLYQYPPYIPYEKGTIEESAQAHIEEMEREAQVAEQERITIEDLQNQITELKLGADATQEALDMLLLSSMGEPVQAATLAVSTFANNKQKGADTMAAYIAMRILKKGEKSVEAGRDYYTTWITHPAYAKYKADIDLILKAEGRDDLIVESL